MSSNNFLGEKIGMSGVGSTYGVGWGQHMGWAGVSGGNGILSISNRVVGCVCNIRMPSVDTVCHSENGQFFSILKGDATWFMTS